MPILLNSAKIGLPRNANMAHPRLSEKAEQAGTTNPQAHEEETLMDQKYVGHQIQFLLA